MSEESKHDGKLSQSEPSYVTYCEGYAVLGQLGTGIRVNGRYSDGYHDDAVLMPGEALSLLAWLQQERETLEAMVKE